MITQDFTPTAETISLHGLGFIQVKLPANRRLHVWHPDLPRRDCYEHSAIHNHRFSFESTVLIGTQVNRRAFAYLDPAAGGASHDLISHDGARSDKGGRLSYVSGQVTVGFRSWEIYEPGEHYFMPMLEYHDTPNIGIIVTIMTKIDEGDVSASSLIKIGHEFHQDFDRFQLSPDELWAFVLDAFKKGLG